jgi:hypothetical protein
MSVPAEFNGYAGLGFHFLLALEFNSSSTASTWYGDIGVAYFQSGLSFRAKY